jgi:hypothetical protein
VLAAKDSGLLVPAAATPWPRASPSRATAGRARDFLDERLAATSPAPRRPALLLDAVLAPGGVCPTLCDAMEAAGPYGAGWPARASRPGPVRIVKADVVGNGHLRLIVAGDDGRASRRSPFGWRTACSARRCSPPLRTASSGSRPHQARRLERPPQRRTPPRRRGVGRLDRRQVVLGAGFASLAV